MEPGNVADKYAVCVKKNNVIVGYLPLGKNGRFAKMIFNLGDGEGMEVPCLLKISGTKNMLQILCRNIQN